MPGVRIPARKCSSRRALSKGGQLLRKEKDETSPFKLFLGGSSNFLHSSFAKSGGFFIFKNLPASRWSLNRKNRSVNFIHGTKLKDQHNEKIRFALALASLFLVSKSPAISLDDIQLWTGSGTNRAALVIQWSVPESLTNSTVPVPVTDKTLVWGYRFNGPSTGTQMLDAILATDPKLYCRGRQFRSELS